MTKKERLNLILQVIEENEVGTQEELTECLNKKGYNVSQATISRDIKELNLIKAEGKNVKSKYIKFSAGENVSPKIIDLFKHVTVSISSVNNLIVIKTLSGNAGTAGMAIDGMHFPQVVGSIAGDDTLLVITKNESDAQIIVKSLRML
ncbi:MAG: arginine repressor [Clostridia bacterium]|nr:arginine repressor [Clostridia bacterium]